MNVRAWPIRWLSTGAVATLVLVAAMLASVGEPPALAAPPNDDIADWAIGGPSEFTTDLCNGGLASPSRNFLCGPTGAVWDSAGNLFVTDGGNGRVLLYNSPLTTDTLPDKVFGKPDYVTGQNPIGPGSCPVPNATLLCFPNGVALDGAGNLWVADGGYHRVIRYDSPLTSDTAADAVFGQPNLVSRVCNNLGISPTSLCSPKAVAFDAAGNLFIGDYANDRILAYAATPLDAVADRVFGQPNFTSSGANTGGRSASSLHDPIGITLDGAGRLFVADYHNARVIGYDAPMTSDSVADYLIGQASFTVADCTALTSAKTCLVGDVRFDSEGNMYVLEWWRKAILVYHRPLQTDFVADGIIGKSNYANFYDCNENDIISAASICAPQGLAIGPGNTLTVADDGNDRVLMYYAPIFTDFIADKQIGQPSAWANSACNAGGVSASSLCFPRGVAVDSAGNVYVADVLNHRVLEYNTPLSTDFVADRVFGQGGSFTTNTSNSPGLGANSLSFPADIALDAAGNLYIADNGNGRVLQYNTPLMTDTSADRVFGQLNFTTNSCLSPTPARLCSPLGVDVDAAGNVYVADNSHGRILEYDAPLTTDLVADRVFGKANFTTSGCNTGGLNASSLCQPWGVAIDPSGAMYAADWQNSRVLKYDAPLTTDAVADVVIGQADFVSNACNNFQPVDADSLCNPTGVEANGTDLYISDTGNNRILRSNGAGPPLQVLGQLGSFTTNGNNQGGESARTLDDPLQINTDPAGRLYATDSDNSRVLIFNVSDDPDLDLIAFAIDNCPTVNNPTQAWSDRNLIDNSPPYAPATDDKTLANSDATGDACDLDSDNDGLSNAEEASGAGCGGKITSPALRDTDGDRVLDGAECVTLFDPTSAASFPVGTQCGLANDVDGDKIVARIEFCYYNSNPASSDTDKDRSTDGAKDGCEIASVNGDRVVSSGDQGMLAAGISGAQPYTANVDINKDGLLNSGDQGLMASFISPPGQCPG